MKETVFHLYTTYAPLAKWFYLFWKEGNLGRFHLLRSRFKDAEEQGQIPKSLLKRQVAVNTPYHLTTPFRNTQGKSKNASSA